MRNSFACDLGATPGMVDVDEARAVTWLLDGDESDVDSAHAAAAGIDASARVYTFRRGHRDPLGDARKLVLREGSNPLARR